MTNTLTVAELTVAEYCYFTVFTVIVIELNTHTCNMYIHMYVVHQNDRPGSVFFQTRGK